MDRKMENYLQILRDTPLPAILVVGGIIFLILSVLQKAGASIEPKPSKERFSIITGFALLISGVILYLVPPPQSPTITPTPIVLDTPTTVILSTSTFLPVATSTQIVSNPTTANSSCAGATVLGPWEHINGLGQDVTIESGDGYVHAVFWRPGGPELKAGYAEVSVLIEPGTKVTFINVAGTAYKYHSSCSKAYVESKVEQLNNDKIKQGGTITTIDISELQTR